MAALAPSPTARLAITEVEFIGADRRILGYSRRPRRACYRLWVLKLWLPDAGGLLAAASFDWSTDQLRATMDYLGYPILGEDTYPLSQHLAAPTQPRLRLLASELAFTDPIDGNDYHFTAGKRCSRKRQTPPRFPSGGA